MVPIFVRCFPAPNPGELIGSRPTDEAKLRDVLQCNATGQKGGVSLVVDGNMPMFIPFGCDFPWLNMFCFDLVRWLGAGKKVTFTKCGQNKQLVGGNARSIA